MNTIAQIFPRTGRISEPEVADGAKPDVPTTDLENEKKKTVYFMKRHARRRLTRNFQKISSDDGNESLQSSSPSLTGCNIHASVTKIVTSERRESP